ncbi:NYN domain-containing protein [bacterium]|nr:MAG: NYN domain-containing protein [bacterium]
MSISSVFGDNLEPLNGLSSLKIALLIDFDNVVLGIDDPGFDAELVVSALRERGSIIIGRVYGDWYRHNRHRRKLMEQGLELVETPAFGPVIKNSADIRIALDGLKMGMTMPHIDTFCLVSGDSDFLPLVKDLQALGKQVLIICGNRFTSDMLRRNCNEFISYENLLAQSVGATEDATTLEGAFVLLHRAMSALRERGSEIRSSTVKQMMLQLNPTFSERNFGCAQFRGFLDKAVAQNLIKLGGRDKVSGEFSVLLPEEDESKIELEAKLETAAPVKPEIKTPVVREPREPRAPRTPRDSRGKAGAVPDITPTGTDLFAPASADETDDHATTASSLISRGLRRGRLRFSGKSGKPEKIEKPFEEIFGVNEESAAPEESGTVEALLAPESVTEAPLEAVAELLEQGTAELTTSVAEPIEIETAPALTEAIEAKEEVETEAAEATKKPARRRRSPRKKPNAEKAIAETAPASEEEAAANEAAVDAAGLTIPGEAIEVVETVEAAPAEVEAEAAAVEPVAAEPEAAAVEAVA